MERLRESLALHAKAFGVWVEKERVKLLKSSNPKQAAEPTHHQLHEWAVSPVLCCHQRAPPAPCASIHITVISKKVRAQEAAPGDGNRSRDSNPWEEAACHPSGLSCTSQKSSVVLQPLSA